MHGREHAAAIRPGTHGLILHTMFYLNEVRREEEYHAAAQFVTPKELELALMLVRTAAAPFAPVTLKESYEERLRALVESRAGSVLLPGTTAAAAEALAADILEALRRSIEAAKKRHSLKHLRHRPGHGGVHPGIHGLRAGPA
jgi:DNA end-binding protein Ku